MAVREVSTRVCNGAEAKVNLYQKSSAAGRMTAATRIVSRIVDHKQITQEPKTQSNKISGTSNSIIGSKTNSRKAGKERGKNKGGVDAVAAEVTARVEGTVQPEGVVIKSKVPPGNISLPLTLSPCLLLPSKIVEVPHLTSILSSGCPSRLR